MGKEIDLRKQKKIEATVNAAGLASESTLNDIKNLETDANALLDALILEVQNLSNLTINILANQDAQLISTQAITTEISKPGVWVSDGPQVNVSNTIAILRPATLNRKKLIIQNIGNSNVRIGTVLVTSNTGIRLLAGQTLTLTAPYCETNAIYAIREGETDSIVVTQETILY